MRESRETHHLQIARTLGKANQLLRSSKANMLAKRMRDERGAVTAEYAVVIMGTVVILISIYSQRIVVFQGSSIAFEEESGP